MIPIITQDQDIPFWNNHRSKGVFRIFCRPWFLLSDIVHIKLTPLDLDLITLYGYNPFDQGLLGLGWVTILIGNNISEHGWWIEYHDFIAV